MDELHRIYIYFWHNLETSATKVWVTELLSMSVSSRAHKSSGRVLGVRLWWNVPLSRWMLPSLGQLRSIYRLHDLPTTPRAEVTKDERRRSSCPCESAPRSGGCNWTGNSSRVSVYRFIPFVSIINFGMGAIDDEWDAGFFSAEKNGWIATTVVPIGF